MYLEKFEEKFLKSLDPLPKNFNTSPQYVLSEKILELDIYSHQTVLSFPKVERHILSKEILLTIISIQKNVVYAWKVSDKTSYLFRADVEIEFLRRLVRKSFSLGYINEKKLGIWVEKVDEIGKMVGAWIKKH